MNNDLISREALKKKIEEVQYTQEFCIEHQIDYSVSMQMLGMVIDNAPTVERPKGKWRFYGLCFSTTQYQCNKCEYLTLEKTNFCPHCGAREPGFEEVKENE